MMDVHFLASGSKANCTLVEGRGELLVIDAGLPKRAFLNDMRQVFPDVADHMVSAIRGIVVSHHHSDHAKYAGELSGALHVPLYASSACIEQAADKLLRKAEPVNTFQSGERFVVGPFRILPVETYHVPGAVGFRVETFDGCAAVFTDLPEITTDIAAAMQGCGIIAVETDYSEPMLATSSYVDELKDRIRLAHMSNERLAKFFSNSFDSSAVTDILLLHLSKENNLPFVAEGKIQAVVGPEVRVVALSDDNLPMTVPVARGLV